MKFFLQILMIMVVAFMLELFLPWWSIAIAGGVTGLLMGGNVTRSFSAGMIGMFLLWFGTAMMLQAETDSNLADVVGGVLPGKPDGNTVAAISGIIAGLVGAFSAATGDSIRSLFVKKTAKVAAK